MNSTTLCQQLWNRAEALRETLLAVALSPETRLARLQQCLRAYQLVANAAAGTSAVGGVVATVVVDEDPQERMLACRYRIASLLVEHVAWKSKDDSLLSLCSDNLERGLLLAQKRQSDLMETSPLAWQWTLRFLDLQAALFTQLGADHSAASNNHLAQAKNVCQHALSVVHRYMGSGNQEIGLVWAFRLRMRLIQVHLTGLGSPLMTSNRRVHLDAALSLCNEVVAIAQQHGETAQELLILFTLFKAQLCLCHQEYQNAMLALSSLGGYFPPKSNVQTTATQRPLYLYYLALMVMLYYHVGNTTTASEHLVLCHAILEQDEDFPMDGNLFMMNGLLGFQWIRKEEYFALVYLLSGLCMSSETNLVPSKKYLLEGIQYLEEEEAKLEGRESPFFVQLKLHLFEQLTRTLLVKSEFQQAGDILEACAQQCWQQGTAVWDAHRWSIASLHASLLQSKGHLAEASRWFDGIASHCPVSEERVYATLQLALVQLQQGSAPEEVLTRLGTVEADCLDGSLVGFRAAFHLAEGVCHLQAQNYHKCKIKILEALKLCSSTSNNMAATTAELQDASSPEKPPATTATGSSRSITIGRFVCSQLKVLSLSIISEVYDTTTNEHCEKMLTAAYTLAKKMKTETLCYVVGRMWRDWLDRAGTTATTASSEEPKLKQLGLTAEQLAHHERSSQRVFA